MEWIPPGHGPLDRGLWDKMKPEIKSLSDAFSIVNVPMSRRLQTAAVASFVCALPATILCWLFGIALLLNPVTFVPMLAYFILIFLSP